MTSDETHTLLGVVHPRDEYVTTKEDVLRQASSLLVGHRQDEYGPPSVNFGRIATMFSVLFPERNWNPSDIALALTAVKIGRAVQGYKRDTAVDLAGYAALWAELSEDEQDSVD